MKEWSLISCQVFSLTSSGIIGEHLELLNWQMEVSKSIQYKSAVNCVQCVLEKKYLFHNDISSHFKFLLSNERLHFCEFFKINFN